MVTQQFQCGAWVSPGLHDSKRASMIEFLDPSALRSTDFCHSWDVNWCLSSWKLPSTPKRCSHLPPMVTKGTILKLTICFSKNRNELICLWPQFCWVAYLSLKTSQVSVKGPHNPNLPAATEHEGFSNSVLTEHTEEWPQTLALVTPDSCRPCSVQPHSCSVPGQAHKTSPCCWQALLHTPVEMGQGRECRNSLV